MLYKIESRRLAAASNMTIILPRSTDRVTPIDFAPTDLQQSVRAAIEKICARFGDDYWLARDRDGEFPHEFYRALAGDGWLGVCIPEAYGGSGLGITEAAVMMQTIAASGAGFSGASAVHMNIFGLNGRGLWQRRAEAAHAAADRRRQG